ncbi:MAG: helix-turn-helix domain-containing protein, partial [Pseudonocardia sp.]|nr:helix-turn-helix domain-containing protein [Pseudonocardia sp.]
GPEGIKPRLVIPVRAGGEWLGSIWAVVTGPVDTAQVQELTRATSVLALHLLRLRAQTGAARRVATDLLRAVLHGTGGPTEPWLPDGPWRIAALGTPRSTATVDAKLDLWTAITRRHGWHRPLLADVEGTVVALLLDHGDPHAAGTVPWLRALIAGVHRSDAELTAAIGGTATGRADLPRSRAEATEVLRLQADGHVRAPVVGIEEVWQVVVTARARAAVRADVSLLGGPLPALVAHDRDHRTPYLETLAAWLDHYGDPTAAAGALHVHPNTLRHRMHRIAEVTPLNLTSAPERLALQLQLLGLQDRGPAPPAVPGNPDGTAAGGGCTSDAWRQLPP